ncbi:MFS transporter [Kitasatospora sp. MAP5-34]|uniref:MFS transporter n=1 Tax=Kitasatospora sp. MAP5-34 TaxID=3035102 RepID=UPI0024751889|nr:MFS transporter [Kitasatospora sp. MAP5-34]MDH6579058.1 MFS family permease [Kitasatospora sp. MAP5-34]
MRMPSVRDYIPATPTGRTFAVTSLINAIGTGLYLTGATIFFIRSVGLSAAQVGLGMAVSGIVGFVATVPIGALADRLGAQRTLVGLYLWRAGWFAALAYVHGIVGFVIVSSCLAAAEAATQPMSQAVAQATTEAADRTRTMAIVRTVRNIGFSAGALIAAPLLAANSRVAYQAMILGTAAAFVLSAVLLARMRLAGQATAQRKVGPLTAIKGFRDWRYLLLSGLNGVLSLHMTLLSVGLPLWALQATGASAGFVPVLILTNTVLSIVLQVPVSKVAERSGGAALALRLGGLALAASALVMALAGTLSSAIAGGAVLLAGCVLLTFGEMWQSVGGWDLSDDFAPEDRKGIYLSVFSLGGTGQRIVGPAVITGGVIAAGTTGWIVLAAVFCLAAFLVTPVVRALEGATARPADNSFILVNAEGQA